jgi:tetratricopeptide (TPR) repeat protein
VNGPIDGGVALIGAWESCLLDAPLARAQAELALQRVQAGSENAAWAFWLQAWAEARLVSLAAARARLQPARLLFAQHESPRGELMCDELEAMLALYGGEHDRAHQLVQAIDSQPIIEGEAFDRFFAHSLRGALSRQGAQEASALPHLVAALDAARHSHNAGVRATALFQLAACEFELHRLEAALAHADAALDEARRCGARQVVTSAAGLLIVIHHAAGRTAQALDMAEFLVDHPQLQAPAALRRAAVPIALAYLAEGDLDRAEAWLEGGSLQHPVDGDNTLFWAWLSARCLLQRGEPRLARDLVTRTLATLGGPVAPYHPMWLARAARDACSALGDEPGAADFAKQALAWRERWTGQASAAVSAGTAATSLERAALARA